MNNNFSMKEILMIFCTAVDQINPILKNHHRRTAIISYNLAKELDMSEESVSNLVIAALLHDIGALTVKDQVALTMLDVECPEPHAKLGAAMLEGFGPFQNIRDIVRYHHVNYSEHKNNMLVPEEAYVLHMADRIEILLDDSILALNQKDIVVKEIEELNDSVFKPIVYEAFMRLINKEFFWFQIDDYSIEELINKLNVDNRFIIRDNKTVEDLVNTLSKVIDFKSRFTSVHSKSVAYLSGYLAGKMGLEKELCREIKLAGYLHDIGKIAVPSELINKPGELTQDEFNIMKTHPYYTYQILKKVTGFENIARWAGFHHEKLDASGYPRKPKVKEMEIESEIIIYADLFAALSETRPYRGGMPLNKVMKIIGEEFRPLVGNRVFPYVRENAEVMYSMIVEFQKNSQLEYGEVFLD